MEAMGTLAHPRLSGATLPPSVARIRSRACPFGAHRIPAIPPKPLIPFFFFFKCADVCTLEFIRWPRNKLITTPQLLKNTLISPITWGSWPSQEGSPQYVALPQSFKMESRVGFLNLWRTHEHLQVSLVFFGAIFHAPHRTALPARDPELGVCVPGCAGRHFETHHSFIYKRHMLTGCLSFIRGPC